MEKEARHPIFTSADLDCLTPDVQGAHLNPKFCATASINLSQNSENYLITKHDFVEVTIVYIQVFKYCCHPEWESDKGEETQL
jgi:hypothetical protein